MKTYANKYILLFLIMVCLFNNQLNAQDKTQPINLETVLQLGGANNLTIQEYKQRQELALADLAKAKEWWLPDLYAGTSIHQLWGNAMNSDGNIFTDVDRNNLWVGIGLNATWDFGDGIFKANAANLKSQAAEYQTEAERNKALLNIIQTYYDFLAAQLYYKAYQQLTKQSDTVAKQIAVQVDAGLRYESELLLAKSNTAHLNVEMLKSRVEYNNKSAALIKLLNLDPTFKLIATDTVLAPLELISIDKAYDSIDSVYQNRPEIKGMELSLHALNKEKKTITTGLFLPEIRIGTYSSYFGDVISPINVREPNGNSFAPTSAINAALVWKIPIGRLTYNGGVKQYNAQISLRENQLAQTQAQVNMEIISTQQEVTIANEQMKIAKEGNQLAEKALQQSIQRQQLGTVRPFEILQAQEIYITSRLDYLNAVAAYNKAQYAHYVAIGNKL